MVSVKAGGQGQDIITPVVYDGFGRQTKDYLPYAAPTQNGEIHIDPLQELEAFYNTRYGSVPNPYSEKILEASPLGRVMEQGAPGAAWMADPLGDTDHTVKFEYRANAADEVRLYRVSTTVDSYDPNLATFIPALEASGFYNASTLYKTITKDENWQPGDGNLHTTEEFKDLQGKVILKRTYADMPEQPEGAIAHDTYYVYDDFGNLSFVIPPKVDTSDGVSQDELDELCYQYVYDHRNRLVEKKLPGKQWEYIVYNKGDLPVLTQDQHLRDQGKWLFTKYDAFGRALYSGHFASADSRETLQTTLEGHPIYEESTDTPAVIDATDVYYSNTAFPNTGLELLTIHYYDDYNFDLAGGDPEDSYGITATTNTKSLNTGTKVRVMGTGQWITTVLYYDEKARLIYSYTKNDYLNITDKIKHKLDFVGKVLETTAVHTKDGQADITSIDKFTYDHTGRLLKHSHQMAGHPEEVLAEHSYDALGQLLQKKIGNTTAMPLQTVDYSYNIRGWLTAINDVNNLDEDLFGFNIRYNNPANGATALYNGNISETQWRTNNTDNSLKHYSYSYDALNRITGATDNTGNYNLNAVTYDKNGNILSLSREGHLNEAANNFGLMDELVYSYDSGNKLLKVEDMAHDTFGFKDDAINIEDNSEDYTYDLNGNMLSDTNKGITSIAYNHLNLPTEIIFNNDPSQKISYIYSADGIKQQKVVNDNAQLTTTDYAGSYIYENSSLKFVNHTEGYIEPDGAGEYDYVYQYKDHLGNIRLNYSDNSQALTDNNFESTTEGWVGNASVLSLENGKLKTEVSNQWAGAQKFLDVAPGDEIHYQMLLDKATTESLNLFFFEHDDSYVKLFGTTIATNADGFISGSYTVSQGTKLRIKIEKGAGADTGIPTHYYLDEVKVLKKEISVREEKNYYPFGLLHRGYNSQVTGTLYPYGFGGKEQQAELDLNWLDFGARNYDAALGRWMNMDMLAEVTYSHNPYHFAFNNPIYFIDPDGLSAYGSQMIVRHTGYYDDGAGNIVYDPNVNSQKDLDALKIDGATYIGDTYYDRSAGTYWDEDGNPHRNRDHRGNFDWAIWLENVLSSNWNIEGNAVDYIGSGFVIVGKGQTTKSNTKSRHPKDDIYIPEEVIIALSSFAKTGKNKNRGNSKVKRSNRAKKVKEFKKGMSHAKKVEKYGKALGSVSVSNTDTITFIIQYWKDGIPHGGPAYDPVGNKEADKAVRKGMATFPELDSVQKIRKYE